MRMWTGVLLLAFVAGCGEGRGQMLARRVQKMNHVRQMIAPLVMSRKPLPMKDGQLDVYALVRSGDIRKDDYVILRRWPEKIPSDEEIERGDYTRFPYDRYRGTGELEPRPIPLVWDKEPDSEGVFIVGMSDGSTRSMDRAELAKTLGQ